MVTVSVDGLRVCYGRRVAVDGVTLRLGPGVHGLLGPNGAGKTSLMRALATVVRPDEGKVRLLDHDVAQHDGRTEARRRLGYLPQTFGHYPGFTVRQFVEYVAWLNELPKQRVPPAVDNAIARVGLTDRAKTRMRKLSGGMLRQVGIAQAIVNDPDVLLLDEPTAGLDPERRMAFRELVRDIGATATVIISTHLVEDVAAACGEVTLLDAGQVAFCGTPAELSDLGGAAGPDDENSSASDLERGYLTALHNARERTALCPGT